MSMTPDLSDWQIEKGGLVVDGQDVDTPWVLQRIDDGGIPERRTQDMDMPSGDGTRFGVDTIGGRRLLLTMGAYVAECSGEHVLNRVNDLIDLWLGDDVRTQPGKVEVLRIKRPGRDTVRVYGRPRRAAPNYKLAAKGWVPVVADFQCADHRYYADDQSSVTVPIVPASPGGWEWDLDWPLSVNSPTSTIKVAAVGGRLPTWLTATVHGPIGSPTVELLDDLGGVQWRAALPDVDLAWDQSVKIDPRPWARTALRNDGATVALSRDSDRMSAMLARPGQWQVRFTGIDETGSASCDLTWRNAFGSL